MNADQRTHEVTTEQSGHRRFVLERDVDETGISGVGRVAEGVQFSDGVCAMRWMTEWPSSVGYYDRGIESVEVLHGHGGKTRVVWLDEAK